MCARFSFFRSKMCSVFPSVLVFFLGGGCFCPHQPPCVRPCLVGYCVDRPISEITGLKFRTGPPDPLTHYSLEYERWKGFVGDPVLVAGLAAGHLQPHPKSNPGDKYDRSLYLRLPTVTRTRKCRQVNTSTHRQ